MSEKMRRNGGLTDLVDSPFHTIMEKNMADFILHSEYEPTGDQPRGYR